MTYREEFIKELFYGTSKRKEEMLDVILELVCPPNFGYEERLVNVKNAGIGRETRRKHLLLSKKRLFKKSLFLYYF